MAVEIDRKVNVSTEHAIHSTTVASDMARPRIRLGKISASTTHTPGPSPTAKHAVQPSMHAITSAGEGAAERNARPRQTRQTPIPPAESISSTRRPTLSMSHSATMVAHEIHPADQHVGADGRRRALVPHAISRRISEP